MTIEMEVANTGFHFRKNYKGYNEPPLYKEKTHEEVLQ